MSHTSRKIYRDTQNGEGVSIGDIQAVLGSPRNDIGGLITYGDIKKWAKYKPYRSVNFETTDASRRNAFYGLSITEYESLGTPSTSGTFLYKLVNGQLDWEYLRPRGKGGGQGGANEWFRFLDFDGYINDAVCPVGDPVTTVFVQNNGTAQIAWDLLSDLDPGNLLLSDIYIGSTPLSSYYLGVLLYKSNSNYRLVTSDNVLGSGDVEITISDFPQSDLGDWMAFPFFSSVHISYNGQTTTGSYVSAGWDSGSIELHFRASSQTLAFYAWGIWRTSAHTAVDIEWDAYNEITTSRTVTPTLVLVYAAEGVQPEQGSTAAQVSLGSVTVPGASGDTPGHAHGTATITRPTEIPYANYVWWLGVAVTGFDTQYEQIEEPMEL